MWFLFVVILVIAVGYGAYKMRAPILAKILGQPQSRIERRLK